MGIREGQRTKSGIEIAERADDFCCFGITHWGSVGSGDVVLVMEVSNPVTVLDPAKLDGQLGSIRFEVLNSTESKLVVFHFPPGTGRNQIQSGKKFFLAKVPVEKAKTRLAQLAKTITAQETSKTFFAPYMTYSSMLVLGDRIFNLGAVFDFDFRSQNDALPNDLERFVAPSYIQDRKLDTPFKPVQEPMRVAYMRYPFGMVALEMAMGERQELDSGSRRVLPELPEDWLDLRPTIEKCLGIEPWSPSVNLVKEMEQTKRTTTGNPGSFPPVNPVNPFPPENPDPTPTDATKKRADQDDGWELPPIPVEPKPKSGGYRRPLKPDPVESESHPESEESIDKPVAERPSLLRRMVLGLVLLLIGAAVPVALLCYLLGTANPMDLIARINRDVARANDLKESPMGLDVRLDKDLKDLDHRKQREKLRTQLERYGSDVAEVHNSAAAEIDKLDKANINRQYMDLLNSTVGSDDWRTQIGRLREALSKTGDNREGDVFKPLFTAKDLDALQLMSATTTKPSTGQN